MSLLGSEPLTDAATNAYSDLFSALFDQFHGCDCAYLDSVRVNGALWEWLQTDEALQTYHPYLPGGTRPWHRIDLQGSFADYLSRMSTKTRYTLRKHVKTLRDHAGGRLSLEAVRTQAQVPAFVAGAISVSRESWQHRVIGARLADPATEERRLSDLAERGILRAYLLNCGDRPCAFLVGYQYKGVFHYAETGFAEEFAHLSPGTVLLYLVIEELFGSDKPSTLNFGVGDGVHKRRFGTAMDEDATVILFRRSAANALRRESHRLFNFTVALTKRLVRRKVSK